MTGFADEAGSLVFLENQESENTPLDVLANLAGFEYIENNPGLHIFCYGKMVVRKNAFYRFLDSREGSLFGMMPPIEIIICCDVHAYSDAERFRIDPTRIEYTIIRKEKIDLSKREPTHAGKEVAELLRTYIMGRA